MLRQQTTAFGKASRAPKAGVSMLTGGKFLQRSNHYDMRKAANWSHLYQHAIIVLPARYYGTRRGVTHVLGSEAQDLVFLVREIFLLISNQNWCYTNLNPFILVPMYLSASSILIFPLSLSA